MTGTVVQHDLLGYIVVHMAKKGLPTLAVASNCTWPRERCCCGGRWGEGSSEYSIKEAMLAAPGCGLQVARPMVLVAWCTPATHFDGLAQSWRAAAIESYATTEAEAVCHWDDMATFYFKARLIYEHFYILRGVPGANTEPHVVM